MIVRALNISIRPTNREFKHNLQSSVRGLGLKLGLNLWNF